MNVLKNIFFLGLALGGLPLVSSAKLGVQNNILGKFFVTSIKGTVTCVSDSRIYEMKKGDTFLARGAIIDTAAGANVTLVFSNGTGIYTDEKTHFEIRRFEQEFFAPNNNLRVEPSNSLTMVYLDYGRLVLNTPQLLSGTIMLYETPHAMVNIRGEKILIEVNDKQTVSHIALVSGNVSVVPRGSDGEFLSIGKRLITGQEAFVKYALNSDGSSQGAIEDIAPGAKKPAIQSVAEAQIGNTNSTGYLGATKTSGAPKVARNEQSGTAETRAKVIRITGFAKARYPASPFDTALKEGALLPKGTIIVTEASSELYLETFKGAIATLRPMSTLEIEKLSVTTVQGVVKKQTSVLNLKAGTVISTIDPATKEINDYGVRTPKGIAHASGTSFSITVEDQGFSVTTTADSVSFTPPSGVTYSISAGNVSVTPPGGQTQPPISLSQAIANNPAMAGVIQTAVTTVSNVVQNNIGSLSSESATNLISKVINTASEAIPAQAAGFASQGLIAVSATSSSTSGSIGSAVSAVTTAAVSGAPAQATQIATAATQADPSQAAVVAASAAKAAPAQAAQVAAAVTQVVTPSSPNGPSQATLQNATAIATAVTTSVPNQAAPVAVAVMQAVNSMSLQATSQSNSTSASTIAAGVTSAAPSQAVPVAAAMMKTLTQITPDAPTQAVAQSGAMLAASVTSAAPPQAQEIATAVLQAIVASTAQPNGGNAAKTSGTTNTGNTSSTSDPSSATSTSGSANSGNVASNSGRNTGNSNNTSSATSGSNGVGNSGSANAASLAAGLITAAVSQVAPASSQAVTQAMAAATNQSFSSVQQSAQQSTTQAVETSAQVTSIAQQATQSSVQSNQATQSVAKAESQAAAASSSGSTSANVAASSSGSTSSASSSGSSSTGAGSTGGSANSGSSSLSVASSGQGSTGGEASSSGSSGAGSASGSSTSGSSKSSSTGGQGSTSSGGTTPSSLAGGGDGSASGGSASSGTSGGSSGSASAGSSGSSSGAGAGVSDKATSVIVNQFDPGSINTTTAGLQSAQSGQSSVQFNVDTSGSQTTVQPTPTVPNTLPIDQTVSPSTGT